MEENKKAEEVEKKEFTAENPDPESNHDWYEQFDPKSSEYHGGGDKTLVPINCAKIPDTMPNEYVNGMSQEEYLGQNVYDPSEDDAVCHKIQEGFNFCKELKKKLDNVVKLIITRASQIETKYGPPQQHAASKKL